MRSKETLKRDAILLAIANHKVDGETLDTLDQAIATVAHHIKAKNFEAAKWLIDQLAGTAKTTVRHQLANDEIFEVMADALIEAGVDPEVAAKAITIAAARLTDDSSGESE